MFRVREDVIQVIDILIHKEYNDTVILSATMIHASQYLFENYVDLSRWVSYYYQLEEVLELEPANILVIGTGDGIVVDILRNYALKVLTLDVDANLNPDIVASVELMPLANGAFDIVLCAEVLEHLHFEKFSACLKELHRVAGKHLVLTLPHVSHPLKFSLKVPFFKEFKLALKFPFFIESRLKNEHCWEIGRSGYSLEKVREEIKKFWLIKKEFVPFENQYHHFFILEKI